MKKKGNRNTGFSDQQDAQWKTVGRTEERGGDIFLWCVVAGIVNSKVPSAVARSEMWRWCREPREEDVVLLNLGPLRLG
jgi:hypothetical protein